MPTPIERYAALTVAEIEAMIARHEPENLHLEFKQLTKSDFSDREDRKHLAECVAGFANGDGGVVVWGVKARRDQDSRMDAAQEEVRIPNVQTAMSAATTALSEATSPAMITARNIPVERPDGSGFFLTVVPATDEGPFMAKLSVDRYMQRSGTSMLRMEHFQVADMLGRRKRPQLSLHLECTAATLIHRGVNVRFLLSIVNTGRGVARFPECRLRIHDPHTQALSPILQGGSGPLMCPRARPASFTKRIYTAEPYCVIHAGGSVPLLQSTSDFGLRKDAPALDLRIDYELFAEEMGPILGTATWTDQQLKESAAAFERQREPQ